MSDASATIPETMAAASAKTAAQTATETAIDRILNGVMDAVSGKFGQAKVHLGTVFHTYLENAYRRYNQIRTLATGLEPQSIVGPNNIYVHIGVSYRGKEIDTHTAENLLCLGNNLLIFGTGGIGKSMLMRYLFLNTINQGSRIPVLLELRKVSEQSGENISIPELIYTCMLAFNAKLPEEQFKYSLELGKYLFLFDGLDEVPEAKAKQTAAALQEFSAKYPKNAYIITSRPFQDPSPLETFFPLYSMMMSKEQAVSLAQKLGNASGEEKTAAFCQQLEETLFDKHKDFAENPLLLSMMFLTFIHNNSIPDHLSDFYEKSYQALYSTHDSRKGMFRRDFRCKGLTEQSFKTLFAHFCFQTYLKEQFEFKEDVLLAWLNKSIQKLHLKNVSASSYLEDLRSAVCLIIQDGPIYRFAHRSFQTYFAAYYTSHLTDQQQVSLMHSIFQTVLYLDRRDYHILLYQLEQGRYLTNFLEPGLRELQSRTEKDTDPDLGTLKLLYTGFIITDEVSSTGISLTAFAHDQCHLQNTYNLFRHFWGFKPRAENFTLKTKYHEILQTAKKILPSKKESILNHTFSFSEIDQSTRIQPKEHFDLYRFLLYRYCIPETRTAITQWLSELDAKRAALSTPNFIDDL